MLNRLVCITICLLGFSCEIAAAEQPNIVVIFCDDLGYGDLGCFGHPTIKTPHLDQMAAEGMKLTQFYAAASVCTPSRAALLTGRLPIRSGMCGKRRVLFPDSAGGLPASEVTLAESLRAVGYRTSCIGKWHLGHLEEYLPTNNGFDSYYGIPYSNDMDRVKSAPGYHRNFDANTEDYNVPLMRDLEIIERPADQNTITKRYTEEAVREIQKESDQPFFLYLAHSMPHIPLFASNDFKDTSKRGLYGDVIEEIDWSVGQILDAIRDSGKSQNTLVFFTSDNGPWLSFKQAGGSAGLLKLGKGSTWEGGMREPTLAWWPGKIQAGSVCDELGSTMDIYTTSIALAGGSLPDDRIVDGVDLSETLVRQKPSPRKHVFYYRNDEIFAVRLGAYKAHFSTRSGYQGDKRKDHDPPLLFQLEVDPSERFDVAKSNPEVIKEIQALIQRHQSALKKLPCQLNRRIDKKSQN